MKVNHIRQNVFPVLAALIWGTAFVAQSVAADHVGPFTFTAARSAVAFVFLLVLCLVGFDPHEPDGPDAPNWRLI